MLVDVNIIGIGQGLSVLLRSKPNRVEIGLYDNCGFNFRNNLDPNTINTIEDFPRFENGIGSYGVCDSIEQFKERILPILLEDSRRFAVGFTKVVKIEQPPQDGWRWHKWGSYIGDKEPQCEYLYDEGDDIQEVFTFSIIEIK